MFQSMRRTAQQLPQEETEQLLGSATSGVLALLGEDGYPYAVPLSHLYRSGKLYFHCAMEGHKIDAIRQHDKASFCVVVQDKVVPEDFTTHYRSVIAFGRIRIVEDEVEKRAAITALAERFSPGIDPRKAIDGAMGHMHILALEIEQLTGKEALALAQTRTQGTDGSVGE